MMISGPRGRLSVLFSLFILSILPASNLHGETAAHRNVIIISVDTLRADHLSCYGYERATSPQIDAFAAAGILFRNTMTQIPLTNPAFVAMMTSTYPHTTGTTRNGLPLKGEPATLAEILHAEGYKTTAILSNWPLKAHLSGLQRGFDRYDDDFFKRRWGLFKSERNAEGVADNTIEWLENRPVGKFFLWVHFSDPHAPYLSHKEFISRWKPGDKTVLRYDSEIAYTDLHIGRLLRTIDRLGLTTDTLILLLADHGESLGEHDYTGHGRRLFDPSMRIPLILSGPGVPGSVQSDVPAQMLDVAPTILGYLGIERPAHMTGRDLLTLISEESCQDDLKVYFETYKGAVPNMPGMKTILSGRNPLHIGLKFKSRKVIYTPEEDTWRLYDLAGDPRELNNLAGSETEALDDLAGDLLDWYLKSPKKKEPTDVSFSQEDIDRLKSLGYVGN